jgi:hypothetical protein
MEINKMETKRAIQTMKQELVLWIYKQASQTHRQKLTQNKEKEDQLFFGSLGAWT